MARSTSQLVWIRSLSLLLLLGSGIGSGCANTPWGVRTTEQKNAGPLPPDDDSREPPPAPFETEEKSRIAVVHPHVERAATTYELDPNLIHGVIWIESRHQPRAKSPAGARGLMQLMPATANAMARQLHRPIARPHDPEFNVMAGSLYLSRLLEKYEGDETLALAAYNAGPGNVDEWIAGDGLPPHSIQYVALVQDARRRFEALNGAWSLPLEDAPTLVASAAPPRVTAQEPEAHVPPPPPPAEPERAPVREPVNNPWAPAPDVYRPTPPIEPPLADTPYLPIEERREAARAPARAPARAKVQRQRAEPVRASGLPSVLD